MSPPLPPQADLDVVAVQGERQLVRRWLKVAPLMVIALGLALFFATGLNKYVSIEMLQAKRMALQAEVAAHPARSVAIYALAYLVLVAISLPGAMLMTMAGGFLFGPWVGSAAAVTGMTGGAIIMFLVARSALGGVIRDWAKAGGLVEKIQAGVRANAFSYLLVLRLMPAFPFWLCNIASGFVYIPIRTYIAATVLGIIPSTVIYSSMGAGLDHVFDEGRTLDMSMIGDPQVYLPIIGLCLLSALPVAFHVWKLYRRRALAESS